MNVTLIYALLAYSSIKQRDFGGVYVRHSTIIGSCVVYVETKCADGSAEGSDCTCLATSLLIHCLLHCLVIIIYHYYICI